MKELKKVKKNELEEEEEGREEENKKAVKGIGGSSSEHKNRNSKFERGSERTKCNEFEIKKCILYKYIYTYFLWCNQLT